MFLRDCAIDAALVGIPWLALIGWAKFGLQGKVFQLNGRKLRATFYVSIGRQHAEFNSLCRAPGYPEALEL